ncbi:MAG: rhodanese-like domain-containing protein, partial [Sphingobacteriales bacterium]
MLQISPKELKDKLSANTEIFLLDVRERVEHEAFNIGGKLIPLAEIMAKAGDIPRNKTVVVYCKMGIRSQ